MQYPKMALCKLDLTGYLPACPRKGETATKLVLKWETMQNEPVPSTLTQV